MNDLDYEFIHNAPTTGYTGWSNFMNRAHTLWAKLQRVSEEFDPLVLRSSYQFIHPPGLFLCP